MTLTPYYVPFSPSYSFSTKEPALKPDSSAVALPAALSNEFNLPLPSDPIEAMLSGRARIIEASIGQVLKEIADRETLATKLIEDIDREMCILKGFLYEVAPHGSSPLTVGDPRRRAALEKEIATLEAEKRREEGSCWKDVASLRKEMRELVREFLEEKRKQQVMLSDCP